MHVVENFRITRLLDGHAWNCKETYEAGRTAFVPQVAALTADEKAITVAVDLSFTLCVRNGNNVSWAPRRPLDPIPMKDVDGSPEEIVFDSPELVLGDENFANAQVTSLANGLSDRATFNVVPENFLAAQDLALFNAGKPVHGRLTMAYRAKGTLKTPTKETPLGYHFGGSYTLFFLLRK